MRGQLEPRFHAVPREMDDAVARLKLDTLGIAIDERTDAQVAYDDFY
jgi:adenosylhomocysteinase